MTCTYGFRVALAGFTGVLAAPVINVTPLLGLVMGALAIRRQGIYFSMITLAMAQMVYFAALRAPFAHGEDGLQEVPRGRLFGLLDVADDRTLSTWCWPSPPPALR